jgi:hypothetical protein
MRVQSEMREELAVLRARRGIGPDGVKQQLLSRPYRPYSPKPAKDKDSGEI